MYNLHVIWYIFYYGQNYFPIITMNLLTNLNQNNKKVNIIEILRKNIWKEHIENLILIWTSANCHLFVNSAIENLIANYDYVCHHKIYYEQVSLVMDPTIKFNIY